MRDGRNALRAIESKEPSLFRLCGNDPAAVDAISGFLWSDGNQLNQAFNVCLSFAPHNGFGICVELGSVGIVCPPKCA
jgi:hypothetical protein